MKSRSLCLIIIGLALINGALAKDVYRIFDEELYVSKACLKNEDGQEECHIMEYEKLEGLPYKSCDRIPVQYSNTSLVSYAYRKVILKFKDGNENKIVTVDLNNNCTIKEVNLEVGIEKIRQIVLHDEKYHVIFYDAEICKEFYCKAIYDSNGNIVKENGVASLIDVYASSDISVNAADKGLLVNEYRLDGQVNLYFIPFEDFLNPSPRVLFSVPHSTWYGISTLENKLGFCAFDDGKTVANSTKKIVCQQYDAEGEKKLVESEIKIAKENHVEYVRAFNYDNGLFVTVNEWQGKNDGPTQHTFVLLIDEHGKQDTLDREHYEIDVKCGKEVDVSFTKFQVYMAIITCFDPFVASIDSLPLKTKCLAENCYPEAAKDVL